MIGKTNTGRPRFWLFSRKLTSLILIMRIEFLYAKSVAKLGRGKLPENIARWELTNQNTNYDPKLSYIGNDT